MNRHDAKSRRAPFVVWAVLSLALTSYCAVWLAHDAAVYPIHVAAKDLREGQSVSNQQLAAALARAVPLDDKAELGSSDLDDAAQVATQFAARHLESRLLAPPLLATAEHLVRERLVLSPADGNSWFRLALVHTARAGFDRLGHSALRMSWLVTPRVGSPGTELEFAL